LVRLNTLIYCTSFFLFFGADVLSHTGPILLSSHCPSTFLRTHHTQHTPSHPNPSSIYIRTNDFNTFTSKSQTLICLLNPYLSSDACQGDAYRSHQSCFPIMNDTLRNLITINNSSELRSDALPVSSSSVNSAKQEPNT